MPHTANAKKAHRKSLKIRLANRSKRSALRTLIKKFRTSLADAEVAFAEKELLFRLVTKRLDQSAAKNLIHRNKAARDKSRLASQLAAAKSS
ncbi:MAG: 30S ribosomal protein S20 [Planctomycetota bacterium]|jgi:small subunit ribosomal protein S20|nr:30S ribosomal protein S20 [Planctomycetota bacterium]MDA1165623.1 30S ribosomal protein S20 [Planctomycetota bacterium]